MFISSLFIISKLVLAASPTKNTEVIVDNLEDKCTVIYKKNFKISNEYKLKKLVLKLKNNNRTFMMLNLDEMKLTFFHLQSPFNIEGYNKNGELVLDTSIEDAEDVGIDLEANKKASFRFSSENITYCTNTLDFKDQEKNDNSEHRNLNINRKMFYLNSPEEKTFITKENDDVFIIPGNHGSDLPFFFIEELSSGQAVNFKTSKKKTKFSSKDLIISFRFIESFDDPIL
ncbi:putative SP-containing protein [Vairimorpha necatrix]|uniref:SP-containing protein n=1 Tax=Vairimorpha necatrix TaxID=6039 RepID=A0AAX4J8W8_9MICR